MQTKDEILEQIRASLAELFELDPVRITLASRLNEDLEIDSIDAVDLIDGLRRHGEEDLGGGLPLGAHGRRSRGSNLQTRAGLRAPSHARIRRRLFRGVDD
jgi:acyl carrier protein